MQTRNDNELLRDYAASRSEAAFGEIVRRYADFVYSAALRQTGNPEQARDVAQTVFVDLARKAGSLRANTVLIGWLCQGARLAALEQLRKDQRRSQRERQAMELLDSASDAAGDWQAVQPVLDEAIASLGHEDRDALLLRFFRNESLAHVGATLGVSEDAAQKRVTRALEKLRGFLTQRGITTTAAALSAALLANAVKAAPSGFANALTAGALTSAAASSSVSLLKLFTLANAKAAILLLALAGGLSVLTVLQLNSHRRLREARELAEQQSAQIDALRAANEQLAAQIGELGRARRDAQDVLRLRGEIARLRRELAERGANSPSTASRSNSPAELSRTQINVKARFVVVPDAVAMAWSSGEAARTAGQPGTVTGLLSDEQLKVAGQYFEKLEGAKVIGQPQVTTLSGNQADVFIGQSIPFDGMYTNVGLILDLIPVCPADASTVELNFNACLRRLTDVSAAKDGSLQGIEELSITNSIRVPDGQTAVVSGRIPATGPWFSDDSADDAARPRTLLIFITPTLIDAAGNRVAGDGQSSSADKDESAVTETPPQGVFPGVVAAQPEPK